MNKLRWVKGNTLPLAVSLYEVTAIEGGFKKEPYDVPIGVEPSVRVVGKNGFAKTYTCGVSGNVVTFTDDGTLPVGYYGVEVSLKESDRNLRTFKCCQIEIVECSDKMNLGDLLAPEALALDSDVFFWAKGDKGDPGDPLTYDDLTPEQKADLTQSCYHKVDGIDITEQNGITQEKDDETFPVAHPDIASQAVLLPQRIAGNKVYEQVFRIHGSSITIADNVMVIEAHLWGYMGTYVPAKLVKRQDHSGIWDITAIELSMMTDGCDILVRWMVVS